jgi:magnesium-transporting ATPase (P-type)
MAEWELRPLSLGEILDRTFSLYRKNFLLFVGITAIPQLLTLGLNLVQVFMTKWPALMTQPRATGTSTIIQGTSLGRGILAFGFFGAIVALVIYVVAYLFAQGGTIYAVSDLYLGRSTTIGESLGKMWGQLLNLFGVVLLNGMATGALFLIVFILFLVPGAQIIGALGIFVVLPFCAYVGLRLITCVPSALLEDLGARESLERSWGLTKDNVGRALLICLLYVAIIYGVAMLFMIPSGVMLAMSAKDPSALRTSMAIMQVGNFVAQVLVGPFLLIAISVFYYDLRVKKEAFDLQMMMNPQGVTTPARPSVPSMLS